MNTLVRPVMWRSIVFNSSKFNISLRSTIMQRLYATEKTGESKKGRKIILLIATAGLGFAGTLTYGKYDPKFRALLEDNIPYVKDIYKWFPDLDKKTMPSMKDMLPVTEKSKETVITPITKKKQDQIKDSTFEDKKPHASLKISSGTNASKDTKFLDEHASLISEMSDDSLSLLVKQKMESVDKFIEQEALIKNMIQNLEKINDELLTSHKVAVQAIHLHTKKLYEALDLPEGKEGDIVWKEANEAANKKNTSLSIAMQKADDARVALEKLKEEIKAASQKNFKNSFMKLAEDTIAKISQNIQHAEAEVNEAQLEASTASDYKDLINKSKEQFRKELQIVLPKYALGDKGKTMTEDELNLLIAHAHRRIEQLQKQLAKLQVTEKLRIEQALKSQKLEDQKLVDSKVEYQIEKQRADLENAIESKLEELEKEFEEELRHQLSRQAAAHADHLQEALKIQQQEIERKYSLDLEEKLLHQKGVFISEVSGSMAHLKGIEAYLRSKKEFDKASRKAQALYLACQAMDHKISTGAFGQPLPLGKELAAIKLATDENNEFINSILAGIPSEAVSRGVFSSETLKDRFQKVKRICRRVASIDENNNSLYKYFICYLQSFLIIDTISIPKAELEGKVAVDPSEWDTFDILSRISYSLKTDNLEQALRYANQLRGESRVVAQDWINEVRLLLEAKLAVKALLAYSAAIGVQAYH